MHLGDFRTAAPLSKHLHGVSLLNSPHANQSGENYAYPGFFALLFAPFGVVAAWRSPRHRARRAEIVAVAAIGAVSLLIAFGHSSIAGVRLPVYDVARVVIPGIRSMLAIVRLVIFSQLALVVVAAIGFNVIVVRIRSTLAVRLLAGVVATLLLWEAAVTVPLVRVPKAQGGDSNHVLATMPAGVVAELPMAPPRLLAPYAFIEAARLVLAEHDWKPRLNGYSGYMPPDYQALVDDVDTFPSARSLAALRDRSVRFVVLHTRPIDTGDQATSELVNRSGYAYIDPLRVPFVIRAIDPASICGTVQAEGAIVVELRGAHACFLASAPT